MLVSEVSVRLAISVSHGASRAPAQESRAVDHVRFAVEQRLDQRCRAVRGRARDPHPGSRSHRRAPGRGRAGWRVPSRDSPSACTIRSRGVPSRRPSTSRVPSLEPSLTTMISRSVGKSMVSSRSMTAATVACSLKTGTMTETSKRLRAALGRQKGSIGIPGILRCSRAGASADVMTGQIPEWRRARKVRPTAIIVAADADSGSDRLDRLLAS